MTISNYFTNSVIQIKKEIEQSAEEYLLNVNAEELAEYYTQKYGLPLIETDENRKITLERGRSSYGRVPLQVYYPIVPKKNLDIVVKRDASRHFLGGFYFQLQDNWLVLSTEMHDERSLERKIQSLKQAIGWKNNDVRAGNKSIRHEIKTYIENRQNVLKQELKQFESIIEKSEIPLAVKKEERSPVVDFSVKKELKPLIKPKPKKPKELTLDKSKVNTLIDYIRNSCLSFEKTPEVFSKQREEDLRNIILGNLNAIFEGGATGETFSKLGKTDIHLRISEGNILIIECKCWDGKGKYVDGINQLFRYLTWRENYGILVTFARRKGFTEVIRKAIEATQEHESFLSRSMIEPSVSEFVTEHRFPDDVEKKVVIYHLLFNLFAG